jgi:hypothetical protein
MRRSRRSILLRAGSLALILGTAVGARPVSAQSPDTGAPAETPATGTSASETPATEAAPADETEKLRRRLKVLEDLVTKLQGDLETLRKQAVGGAPATATSIQDLERKIDALASEMARLQEVQAALAAAGAPPPAVTPAPAATPAAVTAPAATGSVHGLAAGASKVYQAKRGLVVGGYGSALYERFTHSRDDDTTSTQVDGADLAEAFFYVGYRFNDRWLLNSSVGIEHALVADEPDSGEATVEFAYADYTVGEDLGARGGLLLMPLGFLNERHEPGDYFGVRRPEVELRVLPTTWRELGAGMYGNAGPLTWRGYLVTGLDASGFSEDEGIRGGRQQGSEARAGDAAFTARVDYRPFRDRSFGDLSVGASAFSGRTAQDRPGFPPGRLSIWDLHAQYDWRGLRVRGLRVESILSDAGEISLAIDPSTDTAIAERMRGWYLELGYDVMQILQVPDQVLAPFCRYESLDTQEEVPPGLAADPENNLTAKTCGVSWLPIPNVAIKLEAQNFDNRAHTATDQVNLGVGWSF